MEIIFAILARKFKLDNFDGIGSTILILDWKEIILIFWRENSNAIYF